MSKAKIQTSPSDDLPRVQKEIDIYDLWRHIYSTNFNARGLGKLKELPVIMSHYPSKVTNYQFATFQYKLNKDVVEVEVSFPGTDEKVNFSPLERATFIPKEYLAKLEDANYAASRVDPTLTSVSDVALASDVAVHPQVLQTVRAEIAKTRNRLKAEGLRG